MSKKKIVIEVDPMMAVVTLGVVKAFFADMMACFKMVVEKGNPLSDQSEGILDANKMEEVLDEVFQRCMEECNVSIVRFPDAKMGSGDVS